MQVNLNGRWQCGTDRSYDRDVSVPGIVTDPREPSPAAVWLRRRVARPPDAARATLVLKGARFAPSVYVDGRLQSESEGGMAWTRHRLNLEGAADSFLLEIALKTLDELDDADASKIPEADRWRSNLSSCLWDDVVIRFHGRACIERLFTYTDGRGRPRLRISAGGTCGDAMLRFCVRDGHGKAVLEHQMEYSGGEMKDIALPSGELLDRWSPCRPVLYRLTAELLTGGRISDADSVTLARRQFGVDGKRFSLNGRRFTIRAGSVVWHRWLRDPEAAALAWNEEWFTDNVLLRLKRLGANAVRFHLGMPPDRILEACDRLGLLVQAEWSFFHGFDASRRSAGRQWADWFEQCFRHPSVCILHPWNETGPEHLGDAWAALDAVTGEFPPVVLSHRDILHLHRYWWSLFENVGLYFDSAAEFDMPIMVDEFGGNYLDGEARPGGYPTLHESFARFLGAGHGAEERLQLQADASGRIAEYWRRIGAAGFSPFCILGSPEDGNHHFLGPLREGRPKPVWNALSAAYAPVSASIDVWDRNFPPGHVISPGIHLFNETGRDIDAVLHAGCDGGSGFAEDVKLPPGSHTVIKRPVRLPERAGQWELYAELDYPVRKTDAPPRSAWRIWTVSPAAGDAGAGAFPGEPELEAFLDSCGIAESDAGVLAGGLSTYRRIVEDEAFRSETEEMLEAGKNVILLNAGPQFFGEGYHGISLKEQGDSAAQPEVHELFFGLKAVYRRVPEPESVIHPAAGMEKLWSGLGRENTAIWAGMRGGLIVPAVDMQLQGFSPGAMLDIWAACGADVEAVRAGPYFAYEKAGYYHFSKVRTDAEKKKLEERVKFLVADAPALADSINLRAPVKVKDLHEQWARAEGSVRNVRPLAVCGKFLARTAAYEITFEQSCGRLVLAQMLTDGRLAGRGNAHPEGRRPDPGAQQLVLNLVGHLDRTVAGAGG